MSRRLALFVLLILPIAALAHEVAVYPVDIDLKVEPSEIRVRISSRSDYWFVELFGLSVPPPAMDWPEPVREAARAVVLRSFELFLDGKRLEPSSFQTRYIEEPFKIAPPRVRYDLSFPRDPAANVLSGRARFFLEEYAHAVQAKTSPRAHQEFLTRLTISGRKRTTLSLPIEKPEFSFFIPDVLRTPREYARESFVSAAGNFFKNPTLPLFCLITMISILTLDKRSRLAGLVVWSLMMAAASGTFLFAHRISAIHSPVTPWVAVALVAVFRVFHIRAGKTGLAIIIVPSLVVWPGLFLESFMRLSFPAEVTKLGQCAYLAGTFVSGIAFVLFGRGVLFLYRRRLQRLFESVADILFYSHLRTVCGFVLFISLIQIVKLSLGR